MTRVDMDKVSRIMAEVADECILPRFRNLKPEDIAFKIGDDPVTIADKEAEKLLSTRLLDLLPGSKVVGEEGFDPNRGHLDLFFGESPVWTIDPIDGTRNFTHGSRNFGVIVSLAEQNQPVAGWIYDPSSRDVIIAEKGGGSWFNGDKLHVLPPVPLGQMRGSLGHNLIEEFKKSNVSKGIKPELNSTGAGSHEYPRMVVAGPHFGKEASQIHFRAGLWRTTPWDDAAGVLIHREAGGYSAFWNGEPYHPSDMTHGMALTPDRESWLALRDWCHSFTRLSAA